MYREPIVQHDAVNGDQFFFVLIMLQMVGVQPVM